MPPRAPRNDLLKAMLRGQNIAASLMRGRNPLGARLPAWFPAGSLGYRDFVNDRAYKGALLASSTDGLTTTRALAGCYDLLLTTQFAANVPRRTAAGLLIEASAANRLLRSTDFAQGIWGKTDTTVGAIRPDKTQLITEGVAGTAETVQQMTGVPAGFVYMFSMVLARGNHDWIRLRIDEGGGGEFGNLWANLDTGLLGSASISGGGWNGSYGLLPLGGGLLLFYGAYIPNGGATVRRVRVSSATADLSQTRVANSTRYQGFPQYEAPIELPSSFIETAGALVTRPADVITDVVPAGATNANLLYSDAATAVLSGLVPGNTVQLPNNGTSRRTLVSMDYRA